MKKVSFILICFAMPALSWAKAQKSDLTLDLIEKYSIVEGRYRLLEGSKEDCIEGRYEVKKGSGTYSLFAGGGALAMRIQDDTYSTREDGCDFQYTNLSLEKGLKNIEVMNCPKNKISLNRVLEIKFNKPYLTYTLKTHQIIKRKKTEVECRLKLVKK